MDPTLDTAPCGFLSLTDNGTIQTANQTVLDLLDRSRREVEGASIEALLTPGAQLFYHTHFFPLLRMQGHVEEVYLSFRTDDGNDVKCLLNAKRTERDGTTLNDLILLPFEEREQYEDEILRAKKAAEQANQAKDRFLSMVSHELRTPISTIKSLSQYLAMGVQGAVNEDQADYLNRIEGAAEYLDTLINDILDFARLEVGSVETTLGPVRVAEVLDRAESLIEVRIEEASLTYERGGCPPDLYVRADPDRLQQVLLNLLTNAIKFTPQGGTVSMEAVPTEYRVHLRVHDTGIGIAAEDQAQIFDPFIQGADEADAGSEGVGLGLAISQDLTTAMDGTLSVDSEPGQGATFTITLPQSDPPPSSGTTESPTRSASG